MPTIKLTKSALDDLKPGALTRQQQLNNSPVGTSNLANPAQQLNQLFIGEDVQNGSPQTPAEEPICARRASREWHGSASLRTLLTRSSITNPEQSLAWQPSTSGTTSWPSERKHSIVGEIM
jgi:hypothetical protein